MKNLTKDVFEEYSFVPKLLRYFALSPENRVTAPGFGDDVFITYYQDDNGKYHKIVDIKGFGEPTDSISDISLHDLLLLIRWLPELKATAPTSFGFKNMKEQVTALSTAYASFGDY